jgi:hypothetical protein
LALTYGQEDNLRIDWKIQISSDTDVDASSGRNWTVISFEKYKQIYQRIRDNSRIGTREVATDMGIRHEKQIYFIHQLNAQILLFYKNMYVTLQSSTSFEH